ncbi:MAG: hypothetical protein LBG92_03055 [Prevotellaceae bacterium]|jgi:hypothetical protein|nr:hypothetical protein [Prevotellaceae bacterium]
MNKIDFSQQGGFPLTQDTLNFMQSAYQDTFRYLSPMLGNYVILAGCTNDNNVIQHGFVLLNGEVLYTPGGAYTGSGTTVYIDEQKDSATFADGASKQIYFRRTLKFGVGSPSFLWSNFKNIRTLSILGDVLDGHRNNFSNPHSVKFGQLVAGADGTSVAAQETGTSRILMRTDAGLDKTVTIAELAEMMYKMKPWVKIKGTLHITVSSQLYVSTVATGEFRSCTVSRLGRGYYSIDVNNGLFADSNVITGLANQDMDPNNYNIGDGAVYMSIRVINSNRLTIRTADDASSNDAHVMYLYVLG